MIEEHPTPTNAMNIAPKLLESECMQQGVIRRGVLLAQTHRLRLRLAPADDYGGSRTEYMELRQHGYFHFLSFVHTLS